MNIKNCFKNGLSLLIVTFITMSLFITGGGVASAEAVIISVPGDYTTIQAAIDAASPGDTIIVSSANYTENITINKSISIQGVGMPVLISADEFQPVITLEADNVSITGIVIKGGNDGIISGITDGHYIAGNVIKNNLYGMYLGSWEGGSDNNTIIGNIIRDNEYDGIQMFEGGTGNHFIGNNFDNNTDHDIWFGPFVLGANVVHHNIFFQGGKCVDDTDNTSPDFISPNLWYDYVSEQGNFWGDYTGEDANGDGVGDTPYNIYNSSAELANKDLYPIMELKPDLVVVDKHEEWIDEGSGLYKVSITVKNIGSIDAASGHDIRVNIDGTDVLEIPVPVVLHPGDTFSANTTGITLVGDTDNITVCADLYDEIDELNEGNNCFSNKWPILMVKVKINAPDVVAADTDFIASVDIDYVENLHAVQYDVLFNSLVIRLDAITDGLMDSTVIPVPTTEAPPQELALGHWRIVQSMETGAVNGTGYLSVLHFHAVGSAGNNTTIGLVDGILSGMEGEIPAIWQGDLVEIVSLLPGDANQDGVINVLDMTKVARIILGMDTATPEADANLDETVNVADMTKIAMIVLMID
jgi:parallel beta-helix repeat protein